MQIEAERYRAVGEVLAAARRRAGLTQQELAKQLGKPQSFVSQYENGQRRVDIVELLIIARTLGVDSEKLFAEIMTQVQKLGSIKDVLGSG